MKFEFNFCTWGVKCNEREVIEILYSMLLQCNGFIINATLWD